MDLETYGRWPWVAAGLVVPAWSLAAARRAELLEDRGWVAGLAFPILVGHQAEEWVWPACRSATRSCWAATGRTGP